MAIGRAFSNMNTVHSLSDIFGKPDCTPGEMVAAIQTWYDMYYNRSGERCEQNSSQNIPQVAVDNVVSAVFQEYEARPNVQEEEAIVSSEETDDLINLLDKLLPKALQGVCIGGEGFLKPGIDNGQLYVNFIDRNNYIVLGRDHSGHPNDIVLSEMQMMGGCYYTLYERRAQNGEDTWIQNKLYKSEDTVSIGTEVTDLTVWYEELEPEVMLPDTPNIGLIYIKMPMHNSVGPYDDGCSLYASAVDKIRQVYEHEHRQNKEYMLTEPHMIVSQDVINIDDIDDVGRPIRHKIPEYLYAVDAAPTEVGFTLYNPEPHQAQLAERENQLLRHVENQIGLRRGILSQVESEDRTATEVLSSTTRYANLINSLQVVMGQAVENLVELVNLLLASYGETYTIHEIQVVWGNGVLYDEDKDFQRLLDLTNADYVRPEYVIGWQFGAKTDSVEDLEDIRIKYMPEGNSTGRTFGLLDIIPPNAEEETDVELSPTGQPADNGS